MQQQNKEEMFVFRLSAEERHTLQIKADRSGLKKSAYIRMLIRDHPGEYPGVQKELQRLRLEISRVGNNVNQVAKASNAYLYTEQDKKLLMASMREMNTMMQQTVAALMGEGKENQD